MSARKPESNLAFSFAAISVSFDPDAFDQALRDHGVKFIHWRAMPCPVGLIDRYDQRRVHEDHSGCSNGQIYTLAGLVTGIFTGNTKKDDQNEIGVLDSATVQVTLPRTYDDCDDEIMIAPYDRFYLKEESVTVPHKQLVETHITGKDKLSFPVVKVYDLMDAHGKRYGANDFTVDPQGRISWDGAGPGFDAQLKRGVIYSIRYTYRPYFYVDRVLHEVRVAQVEDGLERKTIRMPQSFVLQREHIFEKADKDPLAPNPNDPRQVKGPAQGILGPR